MFYNLLFLIHPQIHLQRSSLDNGNDLSALDLEQRLVTRRARGVAGLPLDHHLDHRVLGDYHHGTEVQAELEST